MDEEQYTLLEAAQKLGVSNSTLYHWISRAGLREIVESQVVETDLRARYLTRKQLEKLAKDHRRTLKEDQQNTAWKKRIQDLLELLRYLEQQNPETLKGITLPTDNQADPLEVTIQELEKLITQLKERKGDG